MTQRFEVARPVDVDAFKRSFSRFVDGQYRVDDGHIDVEQSDGAEESEAIDGVKGAVVKVAIKVGNESRDSETAEFEATADDLVQLLAPFAFDVAAARDALDERIRAAAPPKITRGSFGEAAIRYPRWGFSR